MSLSLTDRMCVLFSSRKSGGQSFVHKCLWKNSVKDWFSTYKAFNLCCEDQPSSGRWRVPCVSRLAAVFTVSLLRHLSRVPSANGSSSWNLVLAKSIFMFWLIQTILVVCRVFFFNSSVEVEVVKDIVYFQINKPWIQNGQMLPEIVS